jgi:putative ABC transport system permease protein
MIFLRVVPLVARMLSAVVERLPGVWVYLSLQQIARRLEDHASALLLIMISLSLAIFSASAANTLDQWLFDSIHYSTGADLAVRELVQDVGMFRFPGLGPTGESEKDSPGGNTTRGDTFADLTSADLDIGESEWYPDLQQYLGLPGVEQVTRVGKYEGHFSLGREEQPCWIMGVERIEFPQVAFSRDDLAPVSLGALMNALGAEPMGVLIPSHLATEQGFQVGDRLVMDINIEELRYEDLEFERSTWVRELVIVGLYDYFPTVYPDQKPTLIVNLEYIFGDPDNVMAYDIWLDLEEDANVPLIVDGIWEAMRVNVTIQGNALEAIKRGQEQADRVGLFGVLNVGFLTAGLMPGLGFVLYSYASLRRRFIQLGILQAIGLLVRQLVGYLLSEQLLLMGIAISNGAFVGLVTSYLFVPFLQASASPEGQVPPFRVLIGWTEAGWLSLSFGVVLFLTMLGTIMYLVRLEVFQAVKLGESL